jgi:sugar/nucleoside kinase (ribokinase family)
MTDATECSGGSVANTVAGIASLGGTPAFIGKVKQDELGEIFRYDMRHIGVHYDTPPAVKGKATARCYIFVTPDAQRTMNTYIGACADMHADDINDALVARSQITYVEGYLWDQPESKDAIRKALDVAHKYKRKVAFSLSDKFCVDRHRDEFLHLVTHHLDILFANESEIQSLMQVDSYEKAREKIRGVCQIAVLTRSEHGSEVVTQEGIISVPAGVGLKVVDTTGAGDLYASGFLFGITQNWPLKRCAEMGTKCASAIIQQIGARPLNPLKYLI